ncbi:MAG: hypothetical protein ACLR7Z_02305 [Bilophila wadsworthia]
MTPWNAFRHPVLLIRLVFTPLLFRSLKTSEELGIAAELRGSATAKGCALTGSWFGRRPTHGFWSRPALWRLRRCCANMPWDGPRWKEGCADDPL